MKTDLRTALDSCAYLAKKMAELEKNFGMTSEQFYSRYQKGDLDDRKEFIEWANFYRTGLEIQEESRRKSRV